MAGTIPYSTEDIKKLFAAAKKQRDYFYAGLLAMRLTTCGRISEVLSIKVRDLVANGRLKTEFRMIQLKQKKREKTYRNVFIAEVYRAHIRNLLNYQSNANGIDRPDDYVFSYNGIEPLKYHQVYHPEKRYCRKCRINGRKATHSTRKTATILFFNGCVKKFGGDVMKALYATKEYRGDSSIDITAAYLGLNTVDNNLMVNSTHNELQGN